MKKPFIAPDSKLLLPKKPIRPVTRDIAGRFGNLEELLQKSIFVAKAQQAGK